MTSSPPPPPPQSLHPSLLSSLHLTTSPCLCLPIIHNKVLGLSNLLHNRWRVCFPCGLQPNPFNLDKSKQNKTKPSGKENHLWVFVESCGRITHTQAHTHTNTRMHSWVYMTSEDITLTCIDFVETYSSLNLNYLPNILLILNINQKRNLNLDHMLTLPLKSNTNALKNTHRTNYCRCLLSIINITTMLVVDHICTSDNWDTEQAHNSWTHNDGDRGSTQCIHSVCVYIYIYVCVYIYSVYISGWSSG